MGKRLIFGAGFGGSHKATVVVLLVLVVISSLRVQNP